MLICLKSKVFAEVIHFQHSSSGTQVIIGNLPHFLPAHGSPHTALDSETPGLPGSIALTQSSIWIAPELGIPELPRAVTPFWSQGSILFPGKLEIFGFHSDAEQNQISKISKSETTFPFSAQLCLQSKFGTRHQEDTDR